MTDPSLSLPIRYACMPRPILAAGALTIEAVQPEHIERIRQWRNEQMDVLRQTSVITAQQQQMYYMEHIWPETRAAHPRTILLAYKDQDRLVGYGGLVHVAWEHRRAEVSFLLDTALSAAGDAYSRYFSSFLQLIKRLAFGDLGLHRLFTETYATRDAHIAILESAGFRPEGVLREHVRIGGQGVDSIIHGCLNIDEALTE